MLRIRRMSLNEGATNRRRLMKRWSSWYRNASSSGSLVKKVPTVGTRRFSLDLPGALVHS